MRVDARAAANPTLPGRNPRILREIIDISRSTRSMGMLLSHRATGQRKCVSRATPRQEALTLMWSNIVENEGLPAVAEVLRNLSPGFRDHVFPGRVPYP